MKLSNKILAARQYAIEKHKDQKYGEHPYVYHLDQVYNIAVEMNLGEDYMIAAYLHDVLEDTDTTKKELEEIFGKHITEMVFAVSGFGVNREERQNDIKIKMALYPKSIDLKMIDRIANGRSSKVNKIKLFNTYQKEHIVLGPIFSKGSPHIFLEIEKIFEINNNINNTLSEQHANGSHADGSYATCSITSTTPLLDNVDLPNVMKFKM